MKNLSIGTRLGGGFALVLLLMALMTAFGVWRLQTVALATNDMTQQPLAVERMISDWYRYVYSAARRGAPQPSSRARTRRSASSSLRTRPLPRASRPSCKSASRHCSPATRKRPCGPTSRRRA